jgi:ectoine hydroxylase-related dioxygenase (phytanoyl-CoA dioxygenase family)
MSAHRIERIDPADLGRWLGGEGFDDCKARFDEEGYVVFERVMPPDGVQRVRDALSPYLTRRGRNDFEGFRTNRVYALLAKAPEVFSEMVTHPLALAFAESELGESCLLSALLAINLHPGETVQAWHYDDEQIQVPRPRAACGVSAFWAIDDMTDTNGATEIIPRSHLWARDEIYGDGAAARDLLKAEITPGHDPAPREDAVKVTMPSGSLMLAKGTLWHRGGANRSGQSRLIVTPQYCPGWARQLENMMAAVPKEIAAALPARTRQLLGYNIHASFMGYVDGVHPDRVLGIDS